MHCSTHLSHSPFDAAAEFEAVQRFIDGDGAVVSFVGVARPNSTNGGDILGLFLEHHPRLTESSLNEIAAHASRRFDVSAIRIVHRCGAIAPGEAIVFVATAAPHRRAAFEAAEYAMDRLKTDAVFWKREDTAGGSRWIEPTESDRAARARWED